MDYQNLILEIETGLATLTINRPEKLNALNRATILELNQALENLANNSMVRTLIITGADRKSVV